jgi:hypothetical protein
MLMDPDDCKIFGVNILGLVVSQLLCLGLTCVKILTFRIHCFIIPVQGDSELVHYGGNLVDSGKTVFELSDTFFAAVTLHDLYKIASERGIPQLRRAKAETRLQLEPISE